MISLVLYGRNDSYGYNLHKRAALSLNCMAELLTDPDDEILFVDYNTPDDFPTFPEAIQDTLTPKAKALLRILRVRPAVHALFKHKSHLLALEPVARNIAVRRSNPANRWILSTNTDMIFVPRNGQSLSEMVRDLPTGYYGIPRFEIPESLWESLDRYDAPGTIQAVGEWGSKFHLNEIVYGLETIKFDAPGDFQLVDRDVLHRIHGFHEGMLLGWHVDSNLCKRLYTMYGSVGDLTDRLFGYHCDHTRQVTPAHKRAAVENNIATFFGNVTTADIPEQAETWGCADVPIEEVRISRGTNVSYIGALNATNAAPLQQPSEASYIGETFDLVGYDPVHVHPYLMDVLCNAPRTWSVAWFGAHQAMFALFCSAWRGMEFTGKILVPSSLADSLSSDDEWSIEQADIEEIVEQADIFIFDFSTATGGPLGADDKGDNTDRRTVELLTGLHSVVVSERHRSEKGSHQPRRVIAINAIHNRFETVMRGNIEYARSPFSTRLRHGYVLPKQDVVSLLPLMYTKSAGFRAGESIGAAELAKGMVASGPRIWVAPGRYRLTLVIRARLPKQPLAWLLRKLGKRSSSGPASTASAPATALPASPKRTEARSRSNPWKKTGAVAIEVHNGRKVLLQHGMASWWLMLKRTHRFSIEIDQGSVEEIAAFYVRIWSSGLLAFTLDAVTLEDAEAR